MTRVCLAGRIGRVLLLAMSLLCLSSTAGWAQQQEGQQQAQQPAIVPAPFGQLPYGEAVADSLPARAPVADLKQLLEEEPGSFLYTLGAVAWPHSMHVSQMPPSATSGAEAASRSR